jgi:membrane-associated phospholipid phosphatase
MISGLFREVRVFNCSYSRTVPLVVCGCLAWAPLVRASDVDPALGQRAAAERIADAAAIEAATASTVAAVAALPHSSSTSPNPFLTGDNRQLRRYASNLGVNLKGVAAPGNARMLLLGAGLVAGASLLDNRTVSYFDQHPYPGPARTGATIGRGLVVAGLTAGLFGASLVAKDDHFRGVTYDLSQAVLVNTAYTYAIKNAIRRLRPDGSDALSFPSGHTSTQFAAATVLQAHYGKKVGIPAYALASFVGASRMASKAHHLSDVVAGAALGYVVGRTVVGNNGGVDGRRNRRLVLGTASSPSGDGVGVSLSLAF